MRSGSSYSENSSRDSHASRASSTWATLLSRTQWQVVEERRASLGIEPQLLDVRRPEDLPGAFEAAAKQRAEALIVGLDGVTQGNLRPIAELAAKQRLPSIYAAKEYVDLGGLMTYGASDTYMYQPSGHLR